MCKASKNLKLNIPIPIWFHFKLGLGHLSVLKAISWLGIFPWMQIRSYQTWAVQTAPDHLWDKQMKTGAWDSARSPIWPCRLEVTGVSEQEAPVSSLQSTVQCGQGCPSCGFCWQMWQRCCSPGRTHLTLAASGENVDVFLEKKCWSHFNTCGFCCQAQYGVEHHVGEERGWDMSVFERVLCSLIGGHIATLGEFFIISRCCAANGRCGPPFFSPFQAAVSQLRSVTLPSP